jgi:hypothetical protein
MAQSKERVPECSNESSAQEVANAILGERERKLVEAPAGEIFVAGADLAQVGGALQLARISTPGTVAGMAFGKTRRPKFPRRAEHIPRTLGVASFGNVLPAYALAASTHARAKRTECNAPPICVGSAAAWARLNSYQRFAPLAATVSRSAGSRSLVWIALSSYRRSTIRKDHERPQRLNL